MYKHILFTTELSETKGYIEDKVIELQKLTNARVSIIHVVEPIPINYYTGAYGFIPSGFDTTDPVEMTENIKKRAYELLQPLLKRMNIAENNLFIPVGDIEEEILNFAETEDVDLIITGSHGLRGWKVLLGSTANAILHNAKCDTLAVRYPQE